MRLLTSGMNELVTLMPNFNDNREIGVQTIINIADRVNSKRRQELLRVYDNTDIFKELEKIRQSHQFDRGNKDKSMRKIASIPIEVDHFFTKVYGKDYYKDKDFFTKHHKEWLVIDWTKL